MKILILHFNEDIQATRRTNINFSFCLVKYAPEHDYFLHCYKSPVPDELKNQDYDAVIIDTTFLCARYWRGKSDIANILHKYSFIKDLDAVKIALPQDDYNNNEVLAGWLNLWNVDAVFTPCYDYREIIYPSLIDKMEFHKSLTGYVDERDIEIISNYALPFEERAIDVGFRSKTLAPYFGRFGQMKSKLGENFLNAIKNLDVNLNIDVSNRVEDTFVGEDWLKFLGNCKFTLGCESGSSMLDPQGNIQEKVSSYLYFHPDADFEEIEAACFPGEDKYKFSAISPRIFECAMAKSCQILIEGNYLDVLKPQEHYISLKPDFSNIKEVIGQMQDTENVKRMIDNCYDVLINSKQFHYQNFAKQILDVIEKIKGKKNSSIKKEEYSYWNPGNIETLIDITNKLSNKTGYGYIPANSSKELCTMLDLIYNSYIEKKKQDETELPAKKLHPLINLFNKFNSKTK